MYGKGRQGEAGRLRANLEAVVKQKRERLDRIDEAFVHERSIDQQTYEPPAIRLAVLIQFRRQASRATIGPAEPWDNASRQA